MSLGWILYRLSPIKRYHFFRADETVKHLFTLSANRERKTRELYAKTLIDSVKRHDLDLGSMESTRKTIENSFPFSIVLLHN